MVPLPSCLVSQPRPVFWFGKCDPLSDRGESKWKRVGFQDRISYTKDVVRRPGITGTTLSLGAPFHLQRWAGFAFWKTENCFHQEKSLSVIREVESQSFLYGYVVEPQVNYQSSLSLSMTICRWRMIIPYSVRLWFLKKIHKKCKEPGRVLGSWKISCIFSIFVFATR